MKQKLEMKVNQNTFSYEGTENKVKDLVNDLKARSRDLELLTIRVWETENQIRNTDIIVKPLEKTITDLMKYTSKYDE